MLDGAHATSLPPPFPPPLAGEVREGVLGRAVCSWRDAVRSGRAPGQAWPAWINIPSKIGQVAAVRVIAGQRRAEDLRRNILIASISPGLIDTGASRPWLDLSGAPQPDEVAGPLVDLALDPSTHEAFYGELVHVGREEPGPFGSVVRSGSIVPWKLTGKANCRGTNLPNANPSTTSPRCVRLPSRSALACSSSAPSRRWSAPKAQS